MGNTPMECPHCGTNNLNELLVTFNYLLPDGKKVRDTTTLPKYLYYLEHPNDKRGKSQRAPPNFHFPIIGIFCSHCAGKGPDGWYAQIPTRRFGV